MSLPPVLSPERAAQYVELTKLDLALAYAVSAQPKQPPVLVQLAELRKTRKP